MGEGRETKESDAEELEDNSVVQAVQEVHERSTNHKETQLPRPHVIARAIERRAARYYWRTWKPEILHVYHDVSGDAVRRPDRSAA